MAKNPRKRECQDLEMIDLGASAIDIGSTTQMAAANPDASDMPVRAFGTFTRDLHDVAACFEFCVGMA